MFGAGDSSDKHADNFGSFGKTGRNNSPMKSEESNVAIIVPRGCKIRDEFVCPITRELITDPVIAADGHTYDRAAIEQWIHTRRPDSKGGKNQLRPSPKTGQPLEHTILIPNHNLKRLLKDMIREGGESLYYREESEKTTISQSGTSSEDRAKDESYNAEVSTPANYLSDLNNTGRGGNDEHNKQNAIPSQDPATLQTPPVIYVPNEPSPGPLLALVHAKILNCRCLGPPESDWNNRSFHLKESSTETLLGGRRRPHEHTAQNFVQFTDVTVSRRHFEIRFHNGMFQIRDLGSAGGTFVRIPQRYRVPLTEGTMIMLGKHQLVVLEYSTTSATDENSEQSGFQIDDYQGIDLIEGFNTSASDTNHDDGDNDELVEDASDNTDNSGFEFTDQNSGNTIERKRDDEDENEQKNDINTESSDRFRMKALRQIPPLVPQTILESEGMHDLNHSGTTFDNNTDEDALTPLIHLRCFAPEGTPIQNRKYAVTRKGATLGRKQSNTISFCHEVLKASDNETQKLLENQHQFVGLDSSISGEHATIQFNEETNQLELFDGVNNRGSTNGTWFRLSPMHEESNWFTLDNKSEILIGTVRFEVEIKDAVVEKDLYE